MIDESTVRAIIVELYNKEFVGDLAIECVGEYYKVGLHLNKSNRPLIIAGEFKTEGEFLDYLTKELRSRQLHTAERLIITPLNNTERYE